GLKYATVTMYWLTLNLKNKLNFMLAQLLLYIALGSIILAFFGNLKKNISLNLLAKSMIFMRSGHQSNTPYATVLRQFGMSHSNGIIPKVCEVSSKAIFLQQK